MNIDHGTFTSFVFSVSGELGKECSMFHKRIGSFYLLKIYRRNISFIVICLHSNSLTIFASQRAGKERVGLVRTFSC